MLSILYFECDFRLRFKFKTEIEHKQDTDLNILVVLDWPARTLICDDPEHSVEGETGEEKAGD